MKNLHTQINSLLKNKKIEFFLEPRIFFLFVAALLVQLWFSKGMLFGGVEVGVPTYTPEKTLKQILWLWWEAVGPGVSFQTISAAIPLYIFMSALERIGIGAIGIQKILFFIIIYFQGLGLSLLFRKFFPQSLKLGILAGLFYIFNPYMMTYVWHRFIYGGIVLSAALPLLIYFYLKLLEQKKLKYVFFFLLTSLLANYMYSAVAPVLAIWLSILAIFLSMVVINRRSIKILSQYAFLTILLFFSWLFTNLWWIYPLIGIKTVFSVFSLSGGVETVLALSEKSTINYVIRGINPYYLFFEEDWGSIYQNPLFHFLSWIPVLFILLGLIFKDKRKRMWPVIILFLTGIFVAKGAAEPFKEIALWFYSHFFFLGVIRNSFEKLGLLVILPASIIAAVGVNNLWNYSKSYLLKSLLILSIIGCGIYVWPMWSDKLFGSDKYPLFFTIPQDYPEVSDFLSKELKSDDGKILYLPISEGDSATYNWQYPYNGTEIASFLFPGSSISKFLYISYIDEMLHESARIFHTKNYELQNKLLSTFGIKYIVLNRNLDWYYRKVDNPQLVEKILDSSPDLDIIKDTLNLKVYKVTAKTNPAVFSTGNLSLLSGSFFNKGDVADYALTKTLKDEGIFLQAQPEQNISRELLQNEIVLPSRIFSNASNADQNKDVIIPRPYIKHLPGSFFYSLAILKENFEMWWVPSYEKPMKMLFLSQKRLMESKKLKEQNKQKELEKSLNIYTNYLDETISKIKKMPDGEIDENRRIILKIAFNEEKEMLESFRNDVSKGTEILIDEDIKKILKFRKEIGLDPYYPVVDEENTQILVNTYQFFIPENTNADLVLTTPNHEFLESNRRIKIFLNGIPKEVIFKEKDNQNWFSLGELQLRPGIHEVALPVTEDKILVKDEDVIDKGGQVQIINDQDKVMRVTTTNETSYIEYSIPNYQPDKTYIMSFYYRVIRGAPPEIQFLQDSDRFKNKEQAKIIRNMPNSSYDFDWGYAEFDISTNNPTSIRLDRATTDLNIRISAPFWNNCESINFRNTRHCQNLKFREGYNKPSVVELREFKIRESFIGTVFLDSQLERISTVPLTKFKKVSPVEYRVDVENNSSPFFVVLKEGFHNGWKLIFNSPKEIAEEKNHFLINGYANGWLINKTGKFSFTIKFAPQESFYKVVILSALGYAVMTLIFVKAIVKKKKQ